MATKMHIHEPLKISECAAELRVSETTVMKWIKGGHLVAFLPPGVSLDSGQPGPKSYRVLSEDWRQFVAAHRFTGGAPEADADAGSALGAAAVGVPTGSDGIKRRRRHASA